MVNCFGGEQSIAAPVQKPYAVAGVKLQSVPESHSDDTGHRKQTSAPHRQEECGGLKFRVGDSPPDQVLRRKCKQKRAANGEREHHVTWVETQTSLPDFL